tara:strand:+ start:1428 stop:2138 length:711 start_codon:yes stop_codon:yes gene_type:complete
MTDHEERVTSYGVYTLEKFCNLYPGEFTLPRDTSVISVTDNKVTVYCGDVKISTFSIIYSENQERFVYHGEFSGWLPYMDVARSTFFKMVDCVNYVNLKFHYGRLRCEDGPAKEILFSDGVKQVEWFDNHERHRKNGPAIKMWHPNGKTGLKKYLREGYYYRKDGPAVQEWYDNGQLKKEIWYKDYEENGCYICAAKHREDGLPAYTKWNEEGNIIEQKWFYRGKEQPYITTKKAL